MVYAFKEGASPESILLSYPGLRSLENVYGSITYYLARQDEVERYLEATEAVWEQRRSEQRLPEPLTQRLEQAKELNPHSS